MSQQVSRPETQLRKVEKQTLPEITSDDSKYRESLNTLSPLLTRLLEPLNHLLGDLDTYHQYFNLNINNYLKEVPTTKSMKEELALIDEMNRHIDELPFFTICRVSEVDFRELKI